MNLISDNIIDKHSLFSQKFVISSDLDNLTRTKSALNNIRKITVCKSAFYNNFDVFRTYLLDKVIKY